ncbi:MAG: hypothetical protein ABI658_30715, partial [Acidimicrobiales bacterium]
SLRRDNDRGVRETGLATHLAGETGQSAQMTTSVFLLFHSRSDRADVVPADPHLFISPLAGDTRNCSN